MTAVESNRKLKAALIGCGRMGIRDSETLRDTLPPGWIPLSHAEAIVARPELELVGLCDVNEARLSEAGQRFGVQNCYTDYKLMLDELQPDIVSVATRTGERCEVIQHAAKAGVRGIHAEKPLARNMRDTQSALQALVESNTKLTYGATRRFMDIYRKAKMLVQAGEVGELQEIVIEHEYTTLMWSHPHSVDLLLFFADCGDVEFVQGTCDFKQPVGDLMCVEEDPLVSNAFVRFSNGVRGVITGASGKNIRLSGNMGYVEIMANGTHLNLYRKKSPTDAAPTLQQTIHPNPALSGTERAFSELANAVHSGSQLSISMAEIKMSQNVLLAIPYSSLGGGKRVSLEDVPEEFTVMGRTGEFYA